MSCIRIINRPKGGITITHLVAGGGLQGLTCALTLANAGEKVILIDARQEIGIPTVGAGFVIKKETIEWINSHNPPNLLQIKENISGWGLRLEWLEKFLTQKVGESGTEIFVKTRIISSESKDDKVILNVKGAGPGDPTTICGDKVIDCLGQQPIRPGWPGSFEALGRSTLDNITEWSGAISIPENIPKEWEHQGWNGNRLSFPRGDGTIECWMKGKQCTPEHPNGWIEILSAHLPIDGNNISIDQPIKMGISIAQDILNGQQSTLVP